MYDRRSFLAIPLALLGSIAPGQPATSPPPAAAQPGPPPMTAPRVIQVLDQTIDWYRTLGIQQQAANEPSGLLILYDNRQAANRVMALALEIARANAELLAKQPNTPSPGGAASTA
ncbi:MAG: hypothetical protein QOF42_1150, partial [Gammaproteobacteria bacterium]|nr:hypothetical protein [Gammaproteobacteria bacterium]